MPRGSGSYQKPGRTCVACGGKGEIEYMQRDKRNSRNIRATRMCNSCRGKGSY